MKTVLRVLIDTEGAFCGSKCVYDIPEIADIRFRLGRKNRKDGGVPQ